MYSLSYLVFLILLVFAPPISSTEPHVSISILPSAPKLGENFEVECTIAGLRASQIVRIDIIKDWSRVASWTRDEYDVHGKEKDPRPL